MRLLTKVRALTDLRRRFSDHPLTRGRVSGALLRLARYQAAWRLTGECSVLPWVGGTRLIVGRGMTGVTPEVYLGVAEFADTMFVGHLLRPDDLFVDVGANAGTYSVLAAKVAGAHAIAVEPIASTAERLRDNLRLNDVAAQVEVVVVGVSDRAGELHFSADVDAINRVIAPSATSVAVPVTTLDALVGARRPVAIKIDVERHEAQVIAGADAVLAEPTLRAVLVETGNMADNNGIVAALRRHGFAIRRYDPATRTLSPAETTDHHNTLFVRDEAWVAARLAAAAPIAVQNRSY